MAKQIRKTPAKQAATAKPASTAKKAAPKPRAKKADQETVVPTSLSLNVEFATYPAETYTHGELGLSVDDVLSMYRNMLLQRRFE